MLAMRGYPFTPPWTVDWRVARRALPRWVSAVTGSPSPPPAVRPATILRGNTRTRTISGTVTRTEAAMIGPPGISWDEAPARRAVATGGGGGGGAAARSRGPRPP